MRDALRRADSLIYARPDSAVAMLEAIKTDNATDELRARHALLLTKARYKNYVNETDDSLISIATDYYGGRGDSLEMQSLFFKGHIAMWQNNSTDALILLSKAADIAEAKGDKMYQGLIYHTEASLYAGIAARQPQLDAALKAIEAFENAGAKRHAIAEHITAAQALIYLDPKSGLEHLGTVRRSPLFDSIEGLKPAYYDNMLLLYQATQDYKSSADSIAHADSLGLVTDPKTIINMAIAYANVGKYDLARKSLARIPADSAATPRLFTAHLIKSYIDEADGNLRSALDNMRLYNRYITFYADTLLVRPYTLELNKYNEAEAAAQRQTASDLKVKSVLTIGILVLVILLVVARLMIVRKNYLLKSAEIDLLLTRIDVMDADNKHLRSEMATKPDADVVDSLRNDLNENITRRIEIIDRICYLWMTTPADKMKADANIRGRIEKLIDDDMLAVLESLVDRRHNRLISRIKADGRISLTNDQYNILLLMLAGLSRESMMAILGKERNAVNVAVHRVKKIVNDWPADVSAEVGEIISR